MNAPVAPASLSGAASRPPVSGLGATRSAAVLYALVGVVLALHLHLALTRSINWDEFHFLSRVHDFARGELSLPLQTLHVRLFGWVTTLNMAGVDQILQARLTMFCALLGTCASIFLVARRFVDRDAAIISVLAYLASGYVIQHGTSFRYDPIVAFACMSSLAILTRSSLRWPWLVAFGLVLGAGFMVSMKIVLYLPAFAGIAWLRWSEDNFSMRRALELCAAPTLALIAAGALYLWHSSGMPASDAAQTMVGRASTSMFGISPYIAFSSRGFLLAIPTFILLVFIGRAFGKDSPFTRGEQIALAGLAAPILSLIVYTNTFPYFFAFILPPVCAALAGSLHFAVPRYGAPAMAAVFAIWAVMIWASDPPSRLGQQRSIQIAASEMFPEPVKYFDFPGFLPQHSKANFFMSVWGFSDYRDGVFPTFQEVMAQETVPLVAAVDPAENPTMRGALVDTPVTQFFLPGDVAALRSTYRRVWGPLWVAGIELEPGQVRSWTVRVPGTYTIEGQLELDGRRFSDGETVRLERGNVELKPVDGPAGLLFGDNITIPKTPEPKRPFWTMF